MQPLAQASSLRRTRLNLGRTLQELALATGISASKLSAAERGLARLTPAEERVVAQALNAREAALFSGRS